MTLTRRHLLATTAGAAVAGTAIATTVHAATEHDPVLALVAKHDELQRRIDEQDKRIDELAARVPASIMERPSVCRGHYRDLTKSDSKEEPMLVYTVDELVRLRDRSIAYHPRGGEMYKKQYNPLIAELKAKFAERDADPAYAAYHAACGATDELWGQFLKVQVEIVSTSATTLAGAAAKARVLKRIATLEGVDDLLPLEGETLAVSLADEIERLAGVAS